MSPFLFWTFAILMVVAGISVLAQPNPVASALSLVVSFIALAALYVSLDAFFLGIIQILVYAGAVMVLFLFIIMLLDLRAGHRERAKPVTIAGGVLIALLFVGQLATVLSHFPEGRVAAPALSAPVQDVQSVGHLLFTSYNLPLQIAATLVLVATIGVVVSGGQHLLGRCIEPHTRAQGRPVDRRIASGRDSSFGVAGRLGGLDRAVVVS